MVVDGVAKEVINSNLGFNNILNIFIDKRIKAIKSFFNIKLYLYLHSRAIYSSNISLKPI